MPDVQTQNMKAALDKIHHLEIEINHLHARLNRMHHSLHVREVVLTDSKNRPRAQLRVHDGAVELHLLDSNDTYRLTMTVSDNESMVALCDEQGTGRLGLIVGGNGETSIHIQDGDLDPRVEIYADSTGRPQATLYDKNLKTIWEAPEPPPKKKPRKSAR